MVVTSDKACIATFILSKPPAGSGVREDRRSDRAKTNQACNASLTAPGGCALWALPSLATWTCHWVGRLAISATVDRSGSGAPAARSSSAARQPDNPAARADHARTKERPGT
jgi:hypothetical protein